MSVVDVTILSQGRPMPETYALITLDIRREVNRIPTAHITVRDGDAAERDFPVSDSEFFEPGKELEIKMRYEGESGPNTTVFKGVVMRQSIEADGRHSWLTVDLKDEAVKLTLTRKSEVYRNKSDADIISGLIRDNRLRKGRIGPTQPKHEEIVQYFCTDWDFMLSRADLQGQLVVVEDGELSLHPMDVQGPAKHRFEYGIDEIYDFDIEVDASHQYGSIRSESWDIKTQKLTPESRAKEISLPQGNLKSDNLARAIGATEATLVDPVSLHPKEQQAWADARMARSRLSMIRGRLAVPGVAKMQCMDVMEVKGIGKRFNGRTVITGLRHRYDVRGWRTDVQFGLSAAPFAEQDGIAELPAAGLLPGVPGLQVGVVDTFETDPDKQLRVKVILPGVDGKKGAVFARLAAPYAGKDHGYVFRPEKGDEVVVGFFNDDPRQAVILGAMHSSKNDPPAKYFPKPSAKNPEKGIVSEKGLVLRFVDDDHPTLSLETRADNKIVLLDDANRDSVHIADQHGNSITMNKDGIHIKSAKNVTIDARDNMDITGKKHVEINGNKVNIK